MIDLIVKLTQRHIDEGQRGKYAFGTCPVALAIKAATGSDEVRVALNHISIARPDGAFGVVIPTPDDVYEIVRDYELKRGMSPRVLTLKVPNELLDGAAPQGDRQ